MLTDRFVLWHESMFGGDNHAGMILKDLQKFRDPDLRELVAETKLRLGRATRWSLWSRWRSPE